MDPEPCTNAASFRASRHLCWYLEVGIFGPYAGLVDAEYGEILGLNLFNVRLVSDGQRASSYIVNALKGELEPAMSDLTTKIRTVAVRNVSAMLNLQEINERTVK